MGNAVRADDPGPAAENSCIIRVRRGPQPKRSQFRSTAEPMRAKCGDQSRKAHGAAVASNWRRKVFSFRCLK